MAAAEVVVVVAPEHLHDILGENPNLDAYRLDVPGRQFAQDFNGIGREEFRFYTVVNGVPLDRDALDAAVREAEIRAGNHALAAANQQDVENNMM